MERFVEPEVLAKKDNVGKMLRLDLTDVNNLHAVENVKVGSAAALVCKKGKTTMQLFESLKQLPKISGYTLSKN